MMEFWHAGMPCLDVRIFSPFFLRQTSSRALCDPTPPCNARRPPEHAKNEAVAAPSQDTI